MAEENVSLNCSGACGRNVSSSNAQFALKDEIRPSTSDELSRRKSKKELTSREYLHFKRKYSLRKLHVQKKILEQEVEANRIRKMQVEVLKEMLESMKSS